ITAGAIQLTQTPKQLLVRRIDEQRLAVLNILNTTFSAIIAIGLALAGVDLWALLATDIVALLVYVIGLYLINPVWVPRLTWNRNAMKYFVSFGGRNVIAVFLLRALDKLDDFWTGTFLGDTPLGFYSRAYTFADYPGQLLGNPISSVILGTYAEVKGDRKKLSK
ncbi:MAG: oligosaccharide flippase family protein, partial [candidate division Zixibacteria bacterium]|nr:oligosaccharide flippase family protein [candidate division Zixibacteria bacterium]